MRGEVEKAFAWVERRTRSGIRGSPARCPIACSVPSTAIHAGPRS